MQKSFLLMILFLGLSACAGVTHQEYPKHWWDSVDQKDSKWWEITPDQANNGEVILSKRNELGEFSNFADTPFVFDEKKYPGVEGLWQSMKYPEDDSKDFRSKLNYPFKRAEVAMMSGHKAKKAGDIGSQNMKKLGINWVTYKGRRLIYRTSQRGEHYQLIRRIMVEKMKQNPKLQKLLLSTGNLKLRPDHKVKGTIPWAWRYYDIYMEFRDQLKKGEKLQ